MTCQKCGRETTGQDWCGSCGASLLVKPPGPRPNRAAYIFTGIAAALIVAFLWLVEFGNNVATALIVQGEGPKPTRLYPAMCLNLEAGAAFVVVLVVAAVVIIVASARRQSIPIPDHVYDGLAAFAVTLFLPFLPCSMAFTFSVIAAGSCRL